MKPLIVKIFRWIYALSISLFLGGVVYQVFLAGQAAVTRSATWGNHAAFGHMISVPLLLAVITMFPARVERRTKWLVGLLFLIYVLQADVILFMRATLPYVAALHPVLALFDFLLGYVLVRRAIKMLQNDETVKFASREKDRANREAMSLGKEA